MALTRAQLIAGNQSDGAVLSGQPQGVRPGGAGITIGTDGIISVNSQTIQGVMKLGQTPAAAAAAYNQYDWPTIAPTPGQQLTAVTVAGVTTLGWGDSDGIPWTQKGQLIVGTGVATDTLLNAGSNTSALMADSGTTSGLIYSNAVTSAMLAPAGNTGQRPNPATAGQFRYNTTTGKFEFATGATTWEEVASGDPTVNGFVKQTVPSAPLGATPNALIPAGTTLERQTVPPPVDGGMRFNTTTGELEVYGPSGWKTVPSSTTGAFAQQTVPTAPGTATPNVVVPGGTTADRQTAPAVVPGEMRFNTTTGKLEVYGGGGLWETLPSSTAGTFVEQTIPTTGTASAVIPGGSTLSRQTAPLPAAGYLRYNSDTLKMEFYDGFTWVTLDTNAGTVTGITGTLPIVITGAAPTPNVTINTATTAQLGAVQVGTNIQVLGGVISVLDATTAQKGVIQIATQAEQITGTDITKAASPATAVAKTTPDQTGFVVLPASAAAPATTGYFHYNSTSNHLEYFNGSASKTAVEREGDNMTGKLSVTPSAIAAGVGGWALGTSNYWNLGAIAVPLPTGLSAGQGGLIRVTAIPTSWPAAGGILKYAGGAAPIVAAVPAIIPYYSDGTNVYLGKATENIS